MSSHKSKIIIIDDIGLFQSQTEENTDLSRSFLNNIAMGTTIVSDAAKAPDIFQYSISDFLFKYIFKLQNVKQDVIVFCDYFNRQRKFFLITLISILNVRLKVAIYPNNEYTIITGRYIFSVFWRIWSSSVQNNYIKLRFIFHLLLLWIFIQIHKIKR